MKKFQEILLNDKKYFNLLIGKRVLKKAIRGNEEKYDIPVYSANIFTPFGFVNKSNISDFNNDFVLWGIDGEFGFNLIKKNNKFATTDHCGIIRLKDDNLIPEFIVYSLYQAKHKHGYDRSLRPSLENMKKIKLQIPIIEYDSKNNRYIFDKDYQLDIAKKFNLLKEINDRISVLKQTLSSKVTFDFERINTKNLTVEEIFDLKKTTNRSSFTMKFVNRHKGGIPVYSASKDETLVNYGYVRDNLPNVKYFEDCMTWNIDGFIGKAFYRKGCFSLSEKVIPLILKDQYKDSIDYKYVKYILEEKAVELGLSFSNKAGKSRIKDISIPFPLNENNKLDLNKQKEISNKLKEMENIKMDLETKIDEVNAFCSNIDLIQ